MTRRLSLVALSLAALACGATRSSSPETAAEREAAPESRLTALAASDSPYARAHWSLVDAALAEARREAGAASSRACRGRTEAVTDALTTLLLENPTAARHGVRAALEVRVRLRACERGFCISTATLGARSRAALLLDLAELAPIDGPEVRARRAEDDANWSAARDDYRRALEAASACPPARAFIAARLAAAVRREEGSPAAREVIDRALTDLPEGEATLARGHLRLQRGFTYAGERDYEPALADYALADEAYRRLGDLAPLLQADALNANAVALGALRRADEAVAANEVALELRRPRLGEGHPLVLISMSNIAVMSQVAGDNDKALAMHRAILETRTAMLEPDAADLAVTLDAIGGILTRSGRAAEALPHCRRSVEIRSRHPEVRVDQPRSHLCLGYALLGVGNASDALREAETALAIARSVQDEHRDLVRYLLLLAHAAEATGDEARAAASRDEADRIRGAR